MRITNRVKGFAELWRVRFDYLKACRRLADVRVCVLSKFVELWTVRFGYPKGFRALVSPF